MSGGWINTFRQNDQTITSSASTVGPFDVTPYNVALVAFNGTFTGVTVNFEGSVDNITWYPVLMARTSSTIPLVTTGLPITDNTSAVYQGNVGTFQWFRVRASAYTSGTVNVQVSLYNEAYDPISFFVPAPSGTVTDSTAIPVSTKIPRTPSAPTFATVGTSSAQALASNSNRKGLTLTNTSANWIFLGIGANTAVSGSGIALGPNGGTFTTGEYDFFTGAINAIAAAASSNLAIQEFT